MRKAPSYHEKRTDTIKIAFQSGRRAHAQGVTLSEGAFQAPSRSPLQRTPSQKLSYSKTHSKPPSKNRSENPSQKLLRILLRSVCCRTTHFHTIARTSEHWTCTDKSTFKTHPRSLAPHVALTLCCESSRQLQNRFLQQVLKMMPANTGSPAHARTHTHTYIYIHTYTHIYIYIHTYIHTHTNPNSFSSEACTGREFPGHTPSLLQPS